MGRKIRKCSKAYVIGKFWSIINSSLIRCMQRWQKKTLVHLNIDIICNNGLEMRIQINTITVPYPRYGARKIMVSTAGVCHLLVSYKGMFVAYNWINYHLH